MKTKSPKTEKDELNKLLDRLRADYPRLTLVEADHFRWSPEDNSIFYSPWSSRAAWAVLHEVGHMLQNHQSYSSDIGLLRMEASAWHQARDLALKYEIPVDEEHIEKCLDSYREWIYRRSSCPVCTQAGIEQQTGLYVCINCKKRWRVTSARFCRVYRKTI